MKRLIWLTLILALLPSAAMALMGDYCSAPPYVTRTIAPNIMVLMDNSLEMYESAYTEAYDPTTTYLGYFEPTSCYSSGGTKFFEDIRNASACTAAAPYRGNVMNWATMSKYDVLQKVLIGGNSTSKQGNANTLVSIGGTFSDKTYNNCIFRVDNANLTLTESIPGACSLLNDPASPMASLNPIKSFWRAFTRGTEIVYEVVIAGIEQTATTILAVFENINLVNRAWAANLTLNVVSGSFNVLQNQPYTITLEAGGDNNTIYYWTTAPTPPTSWLSGPTYLSTGNKENYRAVWSGIATAPGTFNFTVTVTDRDSNTPVSKVITITVQAEALKMNTIALPSGQAGNFYDFTPIAQGGVPYNANTILSHYDWSATGLPTWATIDSVSGRISGTPPPAAAATSTVNLTVTDSNGESVSKSLNLVINSSLNILTDNLAVGVKNLFYLTWLEAGGGVEPYTWSQTGLPSGLNLAASYDQNSTFINQTPTVSGTFNVTVTARDAVGTTADKSYTLTIQAQSGGGLQIITETPVPDAVKGSLYYLQFQATGGTPYVSSLEAYRWSAVGLPAWLTLFPTRGYVTGTPPILAVGAFTFDLTVTDSLGVSTTKTYSLNVLRDLTTRSKSLSVKVELIEDPLTDLNGNDIWDLGETYTEVNGVPGWQGKQGLFQKFWDANIPKARWGMAKFGNFGPQISTCVPASPVGAWYTGIQNATAADSSPLATGLYQTIKYYGFNSGGFTGCTNSDPIDNIPCRKNFILLLSSGANVSGDAYAVDTAGCNQTDALARNACVGYKTDLRSAAAGKQNVYTYVVNTMGNDNNDVLEATATAGGGRYYEASNAATLESQLTAALQDILSQAASGTAVSVLTTSSRGIGSMVQAYFLPVRTDGTREVTWTGYTQDLWIDPQDNLREDTVQNLQLNIGDDAAPQDKVIKLFFDTASNETKVARFTTEEDGSGGTLASCQASNVEPFSATKYLWEAGQKLALKNPDDRTLMTSKKVIHVGTTTKTFATPTFTAANVTGNATMTTALNVEAPYTATEIVDYVRGVDKESGDLTKFRDRRLTVDGSLHVWKLGDIISSTPKVFANTPANTYHIDYGDSSYYSYVTSAAYKQRSSVAFVGANDGVLHAFRVGYLKDTGLTAGIKGLFKNTFAVADNVNTEIGQEMWGFIPFNAFPYLQYLANPGYCHIYFNDLSVRIVDASVGAVNVVTDPTAAKTSASWRSILVGGMRFGGACDGGVPSPPALAGAGYSAYYALDITDPENPVPLWEFSDPDMGHATSYPSIVRTGGKNNNGNWYVAIGSGSTRMPKSSTDMARDKNGYVYFLDLKSGELVKKIGLGHNAIVSDIVAIDSQKDASVDNIYFGTSYRPTATTWGGKLMSLNVAGNVPDLCGSGVTRTSAECGANQKVIFNGAFPFTASPDVARDPSGNIWIYAGAGKYVSDIDEADDSDQIFLGIKAKFANGSSPATVQIGLTASTDFIDRSTVTTTGTVTSTRNECLYNPAGSGSTQFTLQEVVTGIAADPSAITVPPTGWYLILTQGERVISRPLAVGGLVDFLTYKPDNDLCSYGGSSYLYAVDYQKGVAPSNVAIRAPATTNNVTSGAVTIQKGILLGPGAPPTGEAITIPPPKEGQEQLKKKIQVATGVIVEAENTPVISTISKVVHWLKK